MSIILLVQFYHFICMNIETIFVGVAAVAALLTAIASLYQTRRLKTSLQVETLSKLVARFESDSYESKRNSAALVCIANLQNKSAGVEVEEMFDFFDEIAFLVRIKALTLEMTWHEFYHWIRLYYQSAETYIIERRAKEPTVWEDIYKLYPKLNSLEMKKHPDTYKEKLDDLELNEYLNEELSNNEKLN